MFQTETRVVADVVKFSRTDNENDGDIDGIEKLSNQEMEYEAVSH